MDRALWSFSHFEFAGGRILGSALIASEQRDSILDVTDGTAVVSVS